MINNRKFSEEKDEQRDLLSNLVDANEEFLDGGEQRLSEEELVGTSPVLCPATRFFTQGLPFRKHFYVLPCWTRGKLILVNTECPLISGAR